MTTLYGTGTAGRSRVQDRPYRTHEHVFLFSESHAVTRVCMSDAVKESPERRRRVTYGGYRIERAAPQHLATFPEELVQRYVLAGCPEGSAVLDPASEGIGTIAALVARQLDRDYIGVELNPEYVKMVDDLNRHRRNCRNATTAQATSSLLVVPILTNLRVQAKRNEIGRSSA